MVNPTRVVATVCAVAATALVVSACSAGEEESGEVTFWNPLTGADGEFMSTLVSDFNGQAEACVVDFQPIPADDLYPRLYSVVNTGEDIPELLLIHGPRVTEFGGAGLLEPLASLQEINPELNRDNYLDVAWDAGVFDGVEYAVPLDLHGIVTYYNADLLADYGVEHWLDDGIVTTEELFEVEGQLPDGVYAMPGLFVPAVVESQLFNVGSEFAPGGELDLTQQAMVDIYSDLLALDEAGLIAPEDSDDYQVFNSGQALVFPDGTWAISNRNSIDGLNWGLSYNLQADASSPVNMLESHSFVQLIDGGRSEAADRCAADFLEYLRLNSAYWGEAGQVVASNVAFEDPAYSELPQALLTNTEEARSTLATGEYIYTSYVMSALWDNSQDIVRGRIPVEEALAAMQNEVAGKIAEAEAASGN
ncbi:extracellular solute-binding protein [uncultured Demequina sp.]|uniref:extracellular solute-binding protein n=1 Tax=uncultured Demequina sp. TaxID=693499 RepID=UPI0025F2A9B6|nr:extracellular solute-binding protein [uncultured Demequina sp.]